MIAFNNEKNEITWQSNFVAMLPEIEQKLRLAFCRLDPEAREDAIEEGVVHSLLAYVRLVEQDRAAAHFASLKRLSGLSFSGSPRLVSWPDARSYRAKSFLSDNSKPP